MSEQLSSTGLDRADTVPAKLRSTFVLLVMVIPLALLTYIVHRFAPGFGMWRLAFWIVVEALWVFWAVGILFVWWRPVWLRSLFLAAERKAVAVTYVVAYTLIAVALLAIVVGVCAVVTER